MIKCPYFCGDIFFMAVVGKFITVLLLFTAQFCLSQNFEQHIRETLKVAPKLDIRINSRNSFITAQNVKMTGLKIGWDHNNTLKYGLGLNLLRSEVKNDIETAHGLIHAQLRFYTFSPYIEYTFYRDKRWELTIPVQIGLGGSYYRYAIGDEVHKVNKGFVATYEPAIVVQYRVLKYFGPTFGIGYRLMVKNNREIDENFTSPVYLVGLKIFIEDLYKDIFGKELE